MTEVEKDYNNYIREIYKLPKAKIIDSAEEITEMKKIKEYFEVNKNGSYDFKLNSDNQLKALHNLLKNDRITRGVVNNKTISRQTALCEMRSGEHHNNVTKDNLSPAVTEERAKDTSKEFISSFVSVSQKVPDAESINNNIRNQMNMVSK